MSTDLCDALYQVLDAGFNGTEACDVLPCPMPNSNMNDVTILLGFYDLEITADVVEVSEQLPSRALDFDDPSSYCDLDAGGDLDSLGL